MSGIFVQVEDAEVAALRTSRNRSGRRSKRPWAAQLTNWRQARHIWRRRVDQRSPAEKVLDHPNSAAGMLHPYNQQLVSLNLSRRGRKRMRRLREEVGEKC